jgi:hypothetical protein
MNLDNWEILLYHGKRMRAEDQEDQYRGEKQR